MMFNTDAPVVKRLVKQGFKLSLHAYLKQNRFTVLVTASHPDTKALFQGRSSAGDPAEALQDLSAVVAKANHPTRQLA